MSTFLVFSAAVVAQEPAPSAAPPSGDLYEYCTVVAEITSFQAIPRITSGCAGISAAATKGYPLDAINSAAANGWRLVTVEPIRSMGSNAASQTYWLERRRP